MTTLAQRRTAARNAQDGITPARQMRERLEPGPSAAVLRTPLACGVPHLEDFDAAVLEFRRRLRDAGAVAAELWAAHRLQAEPATPDRCWLHGARGVRVRSRRELLALGFDAAQWMPPLPDDA